WYSSDPDQKPKAKIKLDTEDGIIEGECDGDGAVDAAFSTIKSLTGMEDAVLIDYHVGAVSRGADAQGSANLVLRNGGKQATGRGVDTDVVRASAKAYINAVNKLVAEVEKEKTEQV
ncbi:2-isopropylmalate synthase, partial [bacterium]|nr:2-isopropylmalate synthase [bacterium]